MVIKIHLINYIESRTDNNSALFVSLNKPHGGLTESSVTRCIKYVVDVYNIHELSAHNLMFCI